MSAYSEKQKIMKQEKIGFSLIGFTGLVVIVLLAILGRIPQDLSYHDFSDTKSYFLIPNTLNVISNIPFLLVGAFGLLSLIRKHKLNIAHENRFAYWIFYFGTAMVGIGSGYYHLWPGNETLVWDRLPMTIAFMGLYSVIIGEFISEQKGRLLLLPLLTAGVFSVLYWWLTESFGAGDLRFYAVVQFFPIVTIPIILIFFPSRYTPSSAYWLLLGTYVAAKLFEHYDGEIHVFLVIVSGHSIKHLVPALGIYWLLNSCQTAPAK